MRKAAWILAVVAIFVVLALAYYAYAPRHTPEGQPPLRSLGTIEEFRDTFNASGDHVRILLLLSPT